MFFIAYTFKGQVHVSAGQVKIPQSLVLQDKCNIEICLSLGLHTIVWRLVKTKDIVQANSSRELPI